MKLATDSMVRDWLWIQEVIYEQDTWPTNLDGKPLLLTSDQIGNFNLYLRGVEKSYREGLRRNHALDDAKTNRFG